MRILSDLVGTLRTLFRVGKVRLDTSASTTVLRTVTFPDLDLTLYPASTTPTASYLPLRDSSNQLSLGQVLPDYRVNRLSADAGGRFTLQVGTNATISATNRAISVDSYLDKFRVYESGGTARGVYVDLATCAATAGTRLLTDNRQVYGWGCDNADIPPILADLNSYSTKSGAYRVTSAGGTSGTFPAGVTWGSLVVERMDANTGSTQVVIQTLKAPASNLSGGNPVTWHRTGHHVLGWSTWQQLWDGQSFDPTTKANLAGATFTGQIGMLNGSRVNGSGASGDTSSAILAFYDSDGTTRRGYVGDASSGNDDIYLGADTGDIRLSTPGVVYIDGVAMDNTDSGWINCTLIGGWANVSGRTAQYRRIGKRVYLRGAISVAFASNNTAFWNVPVGYRLLRVGWVSPATCAGFLTSPGGAVYASAATQTIAFDGWSTSGTAYVNLDNVSWECA